MRWVRTAALLLLTSSACELTPQAPATEERRDAVEDVDLPSLSLSDLDLRGAELDHDALVRHFSLSEEAARRFALSWVRSHRELGGEPEVCVAVPWRDGGGTVIAYQYVMSDLPDCSSYAELLAHVRDISTRTVGADRPLFERTRLSAEHFFTLAVSAFVFQHPIRDGVKGLPFWVIASDRLERSLPEGAVDAMTPVAVYPVGNEGGLIEVVAYDDGGTERLFSHHRGLFVDQHDLGVPFDIVGAYERFRNMVLTRYGDDPGARLERHRRLWSRYLSAGQDGGGR